VEVFGWFKKVRIFGETSLVVREISSKSFRLSAVVALLFEIQPVCSGEPYSF
jgi:hypothetical protein